MYTIATLFIILVKINSLLSTSQPFQTDLVFEDVLPDIETCSATERNIARCMRDQINVMKSYLAVGVPELGILPFEPLLIRSLIFDAEQNEFNGAMIVEDIRVHGLTTFEVSVTVSPNMDMIELDLNFPLIKIRSKHLIKGKVHGKPVMYDDLVNIHSTNVKAKVVIYGEYFLSRPFKERYFSVNDVSVRFKSRDNEFYITSTQYKKLLSYSESLRRKRIWSLIEYDMIHRIQNIASEAIMDTANKIYLTFPISTLMPVYV